MIFGHFGSLRRQYGAAWATVIASFVTCLMQMAVFMADGEVRLYAALAISAGRRRLAAWLPERKLLARIVRFGAPSGFQLLMDVGSFALFVMLTGRLGEKALAASNIA